MTLPVDTTVPLPSVAVGAAVGAGVCALADATNADAMTSTAAMNVFRI
jgi:hypothetical protein